MLPVEDESLIARDLCRLEVCSEQQRLDLAGRAAPRARPASAAELYDCSGR